MKELGQSNKFGTTKTDSNNNNNDDDDDNNNNNKNKNSNNNNNNNTPDYKYDLEQLGIRNGSSIRVTGRVVEYDAVRDQVLITLDGVELLVSLEFLQVEGGDVRLKKKSLYQFIGELCFNYNIDNDNDSDNDNNDNNESFEQYTKSGDDYASSSKTYTNNKLLKARVCRCVDGLDLKLYYKALLARRIYLGV